MGVNINEYLLVSFSMGYSKKNRVNLSLIAAPCWMKCFDLKTTKIYIYHEIKGSPSKGMQGEGLVAVRCLIDSHRNAFRERERFLFFFFFACLLMCNDNNVIRLQYPKMEHKSKCSWISRGLSLSLCPPHGHTVWRRRRLQCHLKKKKKKNHTKNGTSKLELATPY